MYESWAKWPYPEVQLGNEENISTDEHPSKEHAEAIIKMLKRDGFGGEGKIFPIATGICPLP